MKDSIKTTIAAAACALFLCGVLGAVLYWIFMPASKPVTEKPADIAKFIASDKFDNLKFSEKQTYVNKIGMPNRESIQSLSEAERGKLFENTMAVREQEMSRTARSYCALKTQEEKNKFLDEHIAKQNQRMAEMRANRPPREERPKPEGETVKKDDKPKEQPKRDPGAFAARAKGRMEKTAPEERAARTQFMQDLMARRQQTGQTGGGWRPPR